MYTKFLCALLLASAAPVWAGPVSAERMRAEPVSFNAALHLAQQQAPEQIAAAGMTQAARLEAIPAGSLPKPKLLFGIDNLPINSVDRFSVSNDFMTMRRIGVMQEFPNHDERAAQQAIAQSEIGLGVSLQGTARITVSNNVAAAWLTRYSSEQQLRLLADLRAENQRFAQVVAAQFAAGKAALVDILAPKLEAAELDTLDDALQEQQRVAIASLKRWLGDRGSAPLQGSPPPWLAIKPSSQQWHERVAAHPTLGRLRALLDAADARVAAAQAEKHPDWAVELSYQERNRPFSDMISLQFSVDLPIFAKQRLDPSIAARLAERSARVAELDAMQREQHANLDAQLAQVVRLTQALARQNATLIPLAQEKIRLSTAAWSAGTASLSDVMLARREGQMAVLRALELDNQRMLAIAALHYNYGTFATSGAAP